MFKSLILELNKLQDNTIGLFKNSITKEFELVVKSDSITFTTITIGNLGGLSTNHYPVGKQHGNMKLFPNNKSLLAMMQDVYQLHEFVKSFN